MLFQRSSGCSSLAHSSEVRARAVATITTTAAACTVGNAGVGACQVVGAPDAPHPLVRRANRPPQPSAASADALETVASRAGIATRTVDNLRRRQPTSGTANASPSLLLFCRRKKAPWRRWRTASTSMRSWSTCRCAGERLGELSRCGCDAGPCRRARCRLAAPQPQPQPQPRHPSGRNHAGQVCGHGAPRHQPL